MCTVPTATHPKSLECHTSRTPHTAYARAAAETTALRSLTGRTGTQGLCEMMKMLLVLAGATLVAAQRQP